MSLLHYFFGVTLYKDTLEHNGEKK